MDKIRKAGIIFYQISTKIYFFAKFSINFKLRAYSSGDSHKQCYQPTVHVYSIILAFLTWDIKVTKAIASSTSHNMGSSSSCLHIPNASASSCCRTSKWSNTYSNSQETFVGRLYCNAKLFQFKSTALQNTNSM